jgi:adenylyltransferase/sulfurtransferase
MGVLQALEAINVLTAPSCDVVTAHTTVTRARDSPALHIFSAYSNTSFRAIRLLSHRSKCAVCSFEAMVTLNTIASRATDYVFVCGSDRSVKPPSLLGPGERISAQEYNKWHTEASTSRPHTVIDVRDKAQSAICSLENSINIPISTILASTATGQTPSWIPPELATRDSDNPVYVICHLGNDSQVAVKKLKELGLDRDGQRFIGGIRGGLRSW